MPLTMNFSGLTNAELLSFGQDLDSIPAPLSEIIAPVSKCIIALCRNCGKRHRKASGEATNRGAPGAGVSNSGNSEKKF